MAALVARQREAADADLRAGRLAEQRHSYVDLDADSACCPPGFSCPACPPRDGGAVTAPLSEERLAEIRSLDLLGMMSERSAAVVSGHLAALLAERHAYHNRVSELETVLVKDRIKLGAALRDVDADLPGLRAGLTAWAERGRKAEAQLKAAQVRVAELEARAAAGPGSSWWLAEYEGAEPELFATEAAARGLCDEYAAAELDGWDWFPDGDGRMRQVWTSDLDDSPMGEAPGSVTRLVVSGAVADQPPPGFTCNTCGGVS